MSHDTQQKLLETGMEMLLRQGYNDLGIAALLEKTRIPKGSFYHFFKSFSDSAKCNLNIKAEGQNEHHKIESIFKAFAKATKMAIKREGNELPSTKGLL